MMTTNKHARATFIYSISRVFERAAFFGARTLISIYIIDTIYSNSLTKAAELFSWFGIALIAAKIIGGLLGDLTKKSKLILLIGLFIQTLGCFALASQTTPLDISGIFLLALGAGLYDPNVLAQIARHNIKRPKLLDAAFTIYFSATNIGAFCGVLICGLLYEKYPVLAFVVAGGFTVIAALILLLWKEEKLDLSEPDLQPKTQKKISLLITFILGTALLTSLIGIATIALSYINPYLNSIHTEDSLFWPQFEGGISIGLTLIAAIVWTFLYFNQVKKLLIGYLSVIIGFTLAYLFIGSNSGNLKAIVFIISTLIIIAEIHIAPLLLSIITRVLSPRYLAIAFGLITLPALLIDKIVISVYEGIEPTFILGDFLFSLIGAGILGIAILVLYKVGILPNSEES